MAIRFKEFTSYTGSCRISTGVRSSSAAQSGGRAITVFRRRSSRARPGKKLGHQRIRVLGVGTRSRSGGVNDAIERRTQNRGGKGGRHPSGSLFGKRSQ